MTAKTIRRAVFAAALLGLAAPHLAQAQAAGEKGHCPDNPAGTFRFFDGGTTDQDRARLETLAAGLVKNQSSACILTFVDTSEGGYAKKLAIRRAKWVLDTLTGKGMTRDHIGIELRPGTANQTKAELKTVQVILTK